MMILTPEQAIIRMMAGHTVNVDLSDGYVLDASIFLTINEIMNGVTQDGRSFELFEYLDGDQVIKKEVEINDVTRYEIEKFKAAFKKINKKECMWDDDDFVNDDNPKSIFNVYLEGRKNLKLKQLLLDYDSPVTFTCDHVTKHEYFIIPIMYKTFFEVTGFNRTVDIKTKNSLFYMTTPASNTVQQYEFKEQNVSNALQWFMAGIYND
jgi:hypothetical protein